MKPLPVREKEYRQGLYKLERTAIIPFKWVILVVTLVLWVWIIKRPPSTIVFMLFVLYFLFNSAQTYFFYFSEVANHQIRPLVLFSYLVDVVFVSMLIYLDLATTSFGVETHHDFYVLYFLLVMRGFALFKTIAETIFVNLLISILYFITFYVPGYDLDANFAVSLVLIWLVILMSWFIVMIITRQKTELLEANDRLLRADNLARVGELAAGVAHEINNPIGIIAATTDYLKRVLPADSEAAEEIEAIHREAMRCKRIVQEMLTYANPRPSGTTPLDLKELNEEVLRFVFPRRQTGKLLIVTEYTPEPTIVSVDPNQLKQALLNLYLNARQAIPEGRVGRIVIRILNQPRAGRARIEIEDNGIGIPEDDLDNIFEPFFTRKAHGTGLGLAVTQRIIENSGGSISVRPAPEQGTVFMVDLPLAER